MHGLEPSLVLLGLVLLALPPVRDNDIGPLEVNAGYRRSAADYFQTVPPTLALWGM